MDARDEATDNARDENAAVEALAALTDREFELLLSAAQTAAPSGWLEYATRRIAAASSLDLALVRSILTVVYPAAAAVVGGALEVGEARRLVLDSVNQDKATDVLIGRLDRLLRVEGLYASMVAARIVNSLEGVYLGSEMDTDIRVVASGPPHLIVGVVQAKVTLRYGSSEGDTEELSVYMDEVDIESLVKRLQDARRLVDAARSNLSSRSITIVGLGEPLGPEDQHR